MMNATSNSIASAMGSDPDKPFASKDGGESKSDLRRPFQRVGQNPGRLRSPAPHKISARRGYTLIEMVVVISMLTTMISLAGMTFFLLLRTDKVVLQGFVTERTISRLAILFREDVHRADEGVIEAKTDDAPQRLSLENKGNDPVRYVVTDQGIVRLTVEQGSVVARDDFVLPECVVSLATGEGQDALLRTLTIQRPAAILLGKRQAQAPLRELRIDAYLRPQVKDDESSEQPDKSETVDSLEGDSDPAATTTPTKEEPK